MNIKVNFHTNLDDYYCNDIKWLCIPPQIGHVVDVLYKGQDAELKIVRIKHSFYIDLTENYVNQRKPCLIIELHK